LEAAVPYELEGNLYPAYVRGQTYVLSQNGTAASTEFQKMLDHTGIVMTFVTGSLAQANENRALEPAGWRASKAL
jgi:hypothetical protein